MKQIMVKAIENSCDRCVRYVMCVAIVLGIPYLPNTWAQENSDLNVTLSPAPLVSDQRMTFAFQDVPVRALLQVLAETADVNIVTDESVVGTITLNLKNATWQETLDVIVRAKNLRLERSGTIIYVRGDNENTSLPTGYGANNKYDTSRPNGFKNLRRGDDKQILIDARIVEADDSFSRSLGVKLGFNDLSRSGYKQAYTTVLDPNGSGNMISIPVQVPIRAPSKGAVFGGNVATVKDLSGQTSGVVGLGQVPTNFENNMINFPAAIGSSGFDPASFAVSLFRSGMNRFINLEITALETDGKGKMISNPRVVTSNNVRAIIEQGTEIPYKQTSTLGATNTSFRKASLKLEVTPQILDNGEVVLDVDVAKDSVGTQTTDGYAINTKHVRTQVKIDNGGTLVIGGIYQEDSRKTVDKVPLLGDIPLLGNLFKTTTRATNKTELLIFLTPHILDARGNILPARTANIDKLNIDE